MAVGGDTMNEDDNNLHPWIEPELEARVTAWVLGEASAFEAAELERLVAEKPELAIFKRRIEVAHGLAARAVKSEPSVLRLSPDRRGKLLETISVPPASTAVKAFRRPRPAWVNSRLLVQLAACLVVCAMVAAMLVSLTETSSPLRRRNFAAPMAAGEPSEPASPASAPISKEAPGERFAKLGEKNGLLAQTAAAVESETSASELGQDAAFGERAKAEATGNLEIAGNNDVADGIVAGSMVPAAAAPAKKGVDLVTAPTVTTKSGRHAVINVIREFHADAAQPSEASEGALLAGVSEDQSRFDGFVNYGSPVYATGDVAQDKRQAAAISTNAFEGKSLRSGEVALQSGFANKIEAGVSDQEEMKSAAAPQQTERTKQLLAESDDFYQSGRYDLAQKRGEQVLALDKSNIAARRMLEKIDAERTAYDEKAFNETRAPLMASADSGAGWAAGRGGEAGDIRRKLEEIRIPKLNFREATVREALDSIRRRAATLDKSEADPARRGINIVLKPGPVNPAPEDTRITLQLDDVSLGEALKYVATAANFKTKIEPGAVAVVPMAEVTEELVTKEYKVSPQFFQSMSGNPSAKAFLQASGLTFPPGAAANYLASSGKLIVRNTQANLDLLDTLVDADRAAENPSAPVELAAAEQPVSTFSLHVADVSFQLAKDALARGARPAPADVRPEEFYNAFDYGDPAPAPGEEISFRAEQAAHPFLQQRNLVRIAMKVASAGRAASQPLRLTILLDTSGSMEREDRAASVRRALATLVPLLGPRDRVTLVGFALEPRLLAEQLPGDQAAKLLEVAKQTPSEGGTNLEQALDLAGRLALKQRDAAAQNRVVLLTDGAANLGNADPAQLAKRIESLRQQGVAFDACGVGASGLNDEILEALTRKGDGRYYFLNKPEDANEGFAKQLAGALRPAAENVKVQVKFNPARVGRYRLIGFDENRLRTEDFRNDRVDAAELSAEEAAVALYQVEPLPQGEGELGEVFVRFRNPATGAMIERSWTLPYEAKAPAFDRASPSMQLAGVAALFAERLRGDDAIDLEKLAPIARALRGSYPDQARVRDLAAMFEQLSR